MGISQAADIKRRTYTIRYVVSLPFAVVCGQGLDNALTLPVIFYADRGLAGEIEANMNHEGTKTRRKKEILMGEKTGISWCDHTFNPWIGCTKVSAGCANCYAERDNQRYRWVEGWGKGAPRRLTSDANWKKPFQWAKAAQEARVPRRVFCASLADVFDDEVPQEWREELWSLMGMASQGNVWTHAEKGRFALLAGLEWLVLTKRPENIEKMLPPNWIQFPPKCLRIGVTCEDQANGDRRMEELLSVWSGPNFISYEPALGPLSVARYIEACDGACVPWIDWVICGCESGPGARAMDVNWARSLRDECHEAKVPFFLKQMAVDGKLVKEPELDGRQWLEFPEVG